MFKVFYYSTFFIFLLFAVIFWLYMDEFFNWVYGYTSNMFDTATNVGRAALESTFTARQIFAWSVVSISLICFVISIFAIRQKIQGRLLAYLSLLMSGITIMIFIISLFGHGILPARGIL